MFLKSQVQSMLWKPADQSKALGNISPMFACLPMELIRLIFERAADADRSTARALFTVSRSVQTLVAKSFYHTVILQDISAVNAFAKVLRASPEVGLYTRNLWFGDEKLHLPDLFQLNRAGDAVAALEIFSQLTVSIAKIVEYSLNLISLAIDCRILYLISNPGWVWHENMHLQELVLSGSHYFPPPYPCPHSVERIYLMDSILMGPTDVNIFSQYGKLERLEFYSHSMPLRKWIAKMLPKVLASDSLRSIVIHARSSPIAKLPKDPRITRRFLPFMKHRRNGLVLQEWERRTWST